MMLNVGGAGGGETCAYGDRLGALRRDVALAAPRELMLGQARPRYEAPEEGRSQKGQEGRSRRPWLVWDCCLRTETHKAQNDFGNGFSVTAAH